jgi:two-component system sporulation sensor kinase B
MFFIKLFQRLPLVKKIILGTFLALIASIFVITSSIITSQELWSHQFTTFLVYYIFLVTLCTGVVLYTIEKFRENIRMRAEILKAEKSLALGELAATIAHEIRNPLTVAKGFAQLLKEQALSENSRNYTNYMLEEIESAESIISDYLTYAKPNSEKIVIIDLNSFLRLFAASNAIRQKMLYEFPVNL